MKIVIFGLSISSSWGNGHATLWRGLCRALHRRGHRVIFYEKDVPYYAAHRDMNDVPGAELILYSDWQEIFAQAMAQVSTADVAMVTSYCPDGIAATDVVLSSAATRRVFYDLDTPVTLERLNRGEPIAYIGPRGLRDFDLVLSYTGGQTLELLRERLGAQRAEPLYGSVDPETHYPVPSMPQYESDLSYLGTYAEDRQAAVERLLVEPARRLPEKKFLIGGPLYPQSFPWTQNIYHVSHLPPGEHPAFYCSSLLTLNVTRAPMARLGYCPSGRLFEAAACGVPIVSDTWKGLDLFFEPGRELIVAEDHEAVVEALQAPRDGLYRMARAARERCLDEHTATHRAVELERIFEDDAADESETSNDFNVA